MIVDVTLRRKIDVFLISSHIYIHHVSHQKRCHGTTIASIGSLSFYTLYVPFDMVKYQHSCKLMAQYTYNITLICIRERST